MQHEPYHTCDRCGKKIEYVPKYFHTHFGKMFIKSCNPSTIQAIKVDFNGYLADVVKKEYSDVEDIVTLVVNSNERNSELDLCADCTKAFNEFMKGEK